MQKPVNNKRPDIRVRYSQEEFLRLRKAFARSNCNTIGSYARKMTLGEPIDIIHRNASFDAFVEEMALLRKEMAAIRNGVRWSPENQETLIRLQQRIQETIERIATLCMHP
jgi:hypothetical protein